MKTSERLCACGGINNRGGPTCSRCYMAKYRQTETGKKATRKALKRYGEKYPEKRARWVNTYRERVTYHVPLEVHEIRLACKRLEAALVAAENGTPIHEPSQRRRDQATKRRVRFGGSEDIQRDRADCGADNNGGGSASKGGARRAQS
jgi:hypothetical protein